MTPSITEILLLDAGGQLNEDFLLLLLALLAEHQLDVIWDVKLQHCPQVCVDHLHLIQEGV